MALSILNESGNSGSWVEAFKTSFAKSPLNSLRIIDSDWPTGALQDSEYDALGQGPFHKSSSELPVFGYGFSHNHPNLTLKQMEMVQLGQSLIKSFDTGSLVPLLQEKDIIFFRSDVSAKNTFEAGYNLHPDNEGGYGINTSNISVDLNSPNTPPTSLSTIINPIIEEGTDYPATSFSLATNIIDFGIRAIN